MYRRKLTLGALVLASLAATQIASADSPSAPLAVAAQGGVRLSPQILETTARRGASRTATIGNTTSRKLTMTVRPRPWRQARNGTVAANRSRSLGGVSVSDGSFTLEPGAQRSVRVTLNRVPSRRSQFGALDVVGKPTRRRRGINVAYNLISSLRFHPTTGARRYRLGAGKARTTGRGSNRTLILQVRNRGNTIEPVGGTFGVSGSGGGRSGGISPMRILPGKLVNLRLASLRGLRAGRYTASITLAQANRNIVSVTRRFRIR